MFVVVFIYSDIIEIKAIDRCFFINIEKNKRKYTIMAKCTPFIALTDFVESDANI